MGSRDYTLTELLEFLEERDQLQAEVLALLYDALDDGLEKGYRGKWKQQDFDEHVDHAIMHLLALKYEDDSEDHLAHATCRLAMAAIREGAEEDGNRSAAGEDTSAGQSGEVGSGVATEDWSTLRPANWPQEYTPAVQRVWQGCHFAPLPSVSELKELSDER